MIRFKKILVPVDFSPCSLEAYRVAVETARLSGGVLRVLHVIDTRILDPVAETGLINTEEIKKELHRKARLQMRSLLERHPDEVRMERHIAEGIPFQEIMKMTRRELVDLIVVGRYGGTGELEKIFFGSTAEKVVRVAPCAVLSIPLLGKSPKKIS